MTKTLASVVRSKLHPFRLPRVHHTTINIPREKVSACLDFYTEVLGLTRVTSLVRDSAWFEQGLHLWWGGLRSYSTDTEPSEGHVALVLGRRYESVRARCIKLRLFKQDGTQYWGAQRCYVYDPAGNMIELMEYTP